MSFFQVGKYRVSTFSFGSHGPNGVRVHGRWSIYDTTTDSADPVSEGECAEERSNDVDAMNDADREARKVADALLEKPDDHGADAG
jgi:hypothetical protein